MELPDEQKSKFDQTLQTLYFLGQLVNEAIEYRRMCYMNGRNVQALNSWFHTLDPIYVELSPKLSDKEDKEIKVLYDKIKSMDIPMLVTKKAHKKGQVIKVIDRKLFDNLFNDIRELDKKIRYYLDKKNMRIASMDERWAMA